MSGRTTAAAPPPLDLVTMGRIGVDLYPEQINVPLAEVRTFAKSLGGSPTNVAVAAARLGNRSAVITKVGDDGFGAYLRAALAEFGVWTGWVGTDPVLPTPLAFAEIHPPDHFPLLFYRQPKAPDLNLTEDDFDAAAVQAAPLFWFTGTGLAEDPSRSTTLATMRARAGRPTVLDLDYRPMLWSDPGEAARWLREAIPAATVVVGNREEVAVATGADVPEEAARRLLAQGPTLAIVKGGPDGVFAADAEGTTVTVPPVRVRTLCGLGAGDAFGGALAHGLLAGWELERTLRFANVAGAIVASRLACADAMPTTTEVEDLLAHAG